MPKTRRRWNVCPNCSTPLRPEDNFCSHCGQENHDLRVPFRKLVLEVLENTLPVSLTSVNNKFWNSIRAIFTRPGLITSDFLAGRRARYVPPIRLYVLVSIAFFLLLGLLVEDKYDKQYRERPGAFRQTESFTIKKLVRNDSLFSARDLEPIAEVDIRLPRAASEQVVAIRALPTMGPTRIDSILKRYDVSVIDSNRQRLRRAFQLIPAVPVPMSHNISVGDSTLQFPTEDSLQTFLAYVSRLDDTRLDSVFRAYKQEPNWFYKRMLRVGKRYENLGQDAGQTKDLLHRFSKNLSTGMFVLMPFVALLLWLFYARRQQYRRYYYEHLIFSIHIHTALFLFAALTTLITGPIADSKVVGRIWMVLGGVGGLYFLLALKHVYRQAWIRTILKGLLIALSYLFFLSLFMTLALAAGILL